MTTPRPLLKDQLDRDAVARIAENLAAAWDGFDAAGFMQDAVRGLDELELKARVEHVIAALGRHLPAEFPAALAVLAAVGRRAEAAPHGLAAWPLIDYVARHGLEHAELSLETLRQLTPLFSAEFALRPFLEKDLHSTLARLRAWTHDPDPHVRRLVSEGTRPRLPWARRLRSLERDPGPALGLLEALRDDASEMVRRSVANHLADISRDHPDLVLDLCRKWLATAPSGQRPLRDRLVRRATRSLVKAGHPGVWALLGVGERAEIRVSGFVVEPRRIRLGASVRLAFELRSLSREPQRLVVDYAVHHVKADGGTRPKVFKLRTFTLEPGATVRLEKRHAFRHLTTRVYYSGEHTIELLVNGRRRAAGSFVLEVPSR